MAEGITIKGLDEIAKRLQALPEKLRRKSIRKALNDGTELVRAEAARLAPSGGTGAVMMAGHIIGFDGGPKLKDNIVTKVSVGNTEGRAGMSDIDAYARVGIDYKKVKHGHLVEFGAKPHKIKIKINGKTITVQHPGAKKQPFMRPAFDNKGSDAVNTMTTQLAKAVEEEV
ncbi:hypothetical protein EHM92_00330 [bacterium]|nr:MAG: hypothetical protein EHM92_00330 [bacterium]